MCIRDSGTDCFRWAVLAALYPVRRNVNRLSSYVRHRDAIDCSELLFLLHPSLIKISNETIPPLPFTAWLSTIKKTRIPSSICHRTCTDTPTRFHYYYSTIRPAVIANITSGSKVSRALSHPNIRTLTCVYLTGVRSKLAFTHHQYQFLYDFYLVADFECFLVPSDYTMSQKNDNDAAHYNFNAH